MCGEFVLDEYTLVGYERVDYTNKDGQNIKGHRLHLSYVAEKVDGVAVECVWVGESVQLPNPLPLKSKISVLYNRFGRISGVNLV